MVATAVILASWAWGDPIPGWWLLLTIPAEWVVADARSIKSNKSAADVAMMRIAERVASDDR